MEGAGSASEVNLRHGDIANWGFACATQTPVVLVGDIDRGGVIAALVGTWHLIQDAERNLLKGYIINKFRGDTALFDAGLTTITDHTGWPCYGIAPYWPDAHKLPAEDSMALQNINNAPFSFHGNTIPKKVKIGVLAYPHLSNFDDFDPLRMEPEIDLCFYRSDEAIPGDMDWLILPGSKATRADLDVLYDCGWDVDIKAHLRRGGGVIGICGGYQMLGHALHDPDGTEGVAGTCAGLGLLDMQTVWQPQKTLRETRGVHLASGQNVSGYRMHMGHTTGPDLARPLFCLEDGNEGAASANGKVMGSYLHGLFANDAFRKHIMQLGTSSLANYDAQIDETLDALANHLDHYFDLEGLYKVASAT